MTRDSYNRAYELAKIILETDPSKLLQDPRNPQENADRLAAFIKALAENINRDLPN